MAIEASAWQPPEPSELTAHIVSAVNRHVDFDLAPIKAELLERLEEPSDEYVWVRAETIAEDVIDSTWPEELIAQCEKGLAEARADFLIAATRCEEAVDDLRANGRESWIARAVRHRLAFDTAWNTLDERHGVQAHECDAMPDSKMLSSPRGDAQHPQRAGGGGRRPEGAGREPR
jgi:hypothetical protein